MISSRVLAQVIGACALASVLIGSRATYAGTVEQLPTETVRYADLDLDSRSDVETLFRRITFAAGEVCKEYERGGSYLPTAAYQACIRNAVSGAVRMVDSALLTVYYRERDDRHSLNTASR
jgi:UrcA family protein